MKNAFQVCGRHGVLTPSAIKSYRQNGLLIAQNFLDKSQTRSLTEAVRSCTQRRGQKVFPAMDKQNETGIRFQASMERKQTSTTAGGQQQQPSSSSSPAADAEAEEKVEVQYQAQNMHLKMKNARQVDRVFRRLTRTRDKYNEFKYISSVVTPEEERSGRLAPGRMREVREKMSSEENLKKGFEAYRDSGKMEKEVLRDNFINDAMEIMMNWTKGWSFLWQDDEQLRAHVLGSVGQQIGEAAAALSGEVVMRLYADSAHESCPFLNATPFSFAASSAHFRSTTAMSALIGLEDTTGNNHAGTPQLVVLPGSHSVLQALTRGGEEMERFQISHIFDAGRALRMTPDLHHLPLVELPPLEPGAVLFLNNFVLASTLPVMEANAASPYTAPSVAPSVNPYQYALSLFPDRCVFDGRKGSWLCDDSHGPLYKYAKGQPMTDDAVFPILHSALDIE